MFRLIFTYLFLFFLGGFSYSQVLNNNLVVISENGKRFILYVDGEKVNNEAQANVKAFNISEGWCKLKAEFENDNLVVSDSIHIKAFEKNNNKEITYSIKQVNAKSAKFNFVSIGELSAPKIPRVAEAPVDKGPVIDNNTYGNLYKAKENKPIFFKNYSDSTKTCSVDLSDMDIKFGINLINKTNDILNKFKYAESIIDQNCYTVNQLIQILNLLEIEMDKLKLVKRGYSHIKDKSNAKKIDGVFKFKSMKEDYDSFLLDVANASHQENLHCAVAISDEKLNSIISTIKKGHYEHDKIKIAKEEVVNNCFNTLQVEKLLALFSYDREKMDFAKAAYAVTVDKENYKILVENFQFSENKSDFLKFISK
ncbi:MAG: DUF4476 domain-containing protein [Bacteroidia bacterium]|nr:DUF4476 domain-containing protein [Bacteroidia bacterium]